MSTNPAANFSDRRQRFRQYEDDAAVRAYLARLEREWPERAQIAQHIADLVRALGQAQPQLLELCCGPGRLAATLLKEIPALHYTGVDLSPPFLAFARQQLAAYVNRVELLEVDLSEELWPQEIQGQSPIQSRQFHAIVSLQSLHDVGDDAVISRVYGQAKSLLLPGGFFLNADLIVAEGEELPHNPGRRSISRHLELLQRHGYQQITCELAVGGFGVVIGWQLANE